MDYFQVIDRVTAMVLENWRSIPQVNKYKTFHKPGTTTVEFLPGVVEELQKALCSQVADALEMAYKLQDKEINRDAIQLHIRSLSLLGENKDGDVRTEYSVDNLYTFVLINGQCPDYWDWTNEEKFTGDDGFLYQKTASGQYKGEKITETSGMIDDGLPHGADFSDEMFKQL